MSAEKNEKYQVISNEDLKKERARIIKTASEGAHFVIMRQDGRHVKIGPSDETALPAEYLEVVSLLQQIPREKIANIREMLLQIISLARP